MQVPFGFLAFFTLRLFCLLSTGALVFLGFWCVPLLMLNNRIGYSSLGWHLVLVNKSMEYKCVLQLFLLNRLYIAKYL